MDDLGERDRPGRGGRLRGRRERCPVGHRDRLPVDCQMATQEVDPVDGEAEGLALT
jgi:hypothetical protein